MTVEINTNTKTADEIRKEFIDFFKQKNHTEVPSAPVIPYDDPSIMFNIAGMNQFKDVFIGTGKRDFVRAVDSQKCIRAGGKHNDLDEVGKDSYHHSFFEMLGNWSFGDYYKKEAIDWAWELLTEVWKLSKEKLYVTVYKDDDEAEELWLKHTEIATDHVSRHGDKDNFWAMGDTGPCGPCSEIHYDKGEVFCNKKDDPSHICAVNGDCDRIIEIWNLVFIQYNRNKAGELIPLPKTHVDTGMGFERICMILQNKDSNYHIDIFEKIINKIEEITGVKYTGDDNGVAHRVIADHIRTLLFAISDGALPSNEGRGYVLRRILRRAARFGTKLNMNEPFLYKIVPEVVKVMGSQYPEIKKYEKHAQNVIFSEEKSFLQTLSKGIELFNSIIEEIKSENGLIIQGSTAFKLYDTFGFPLDLTTQMALERGLSVDEDGFKKEMEKQKSQSKKNAKFKSKEIIDWIEISDDKKTEFKGYNSDFPDEIPAGESKVIKYFVDTTKKILKLVPAISYLYAESGGQVADKGSVKIGTLSLDIFDVQKDGEYFVLFAKLGDKVLPPIDDEIMIYEIIEPNFRNGCRIHHSATHLLQSAMRKILGDHIAQSGSFVNSTSLRFDYSHYEKLTDDEIDSIERYVNLFIRSNYKITTDIKSIEEAKTMNVTALFGEKYGAEVRVVTMGEVSGELCGGTHANRTGDIGYFKIISEASIASGVRRIEAVCGENAVAVSRTEKKRSDFIKETLVCKEEQILDRFKKLLEDKKDLEKKINNLNEKLAASKVTDLLSKKVEINGISVISAIIEAQDGKILKSIGENLRNSLQSGIALLGADFGDKAGLVCVVTDDLKNTYKAGSIISKAAKMIGGGGGGAPHIATAGGRDTANLQNAINSIEEFLK